MTQPGSPADESDKVRALPSRESLLAAQERMTRENMRGNFKNTRLTVVGGVFAALIAAAATVFTAVYSADGRAGSANSQSFPPSGPSPVVDGSGSITRSPLPASPTTAGTQALPSSPPFASANPSTAQPRKSQAVTSVGSARETVTVSLSTTNYLYLGSRPVMVTPNNSYNNVGPDLQSGPGSLRSRGSTDFAPATDPSCQGGSWTRNAIPLGRGATGDHCGRLAATRPMKHFKMHIAVDDSDLCTIVIEFLDP